MRNIKHELLLSLKKKKRKEKRINQEFNDFWLGSCMSLSLSEWGKQSWARFDPSLCFPSPSLSSLYSPLNATDGITAHTDPSCPCSPVPSQTGVTTEWTGRQKKGKTKFGSISVAFALLPGYGERINSFSLTCLLPVNYSTTLFSSDGVGGWFRSVFHTNTNTLMHKHPFSLAAELAFIVVKINFTGTQMHQILKGKSGA